MLIRVSYKQPRHNSSGGAWKLTVVETMLHFSSFNHLISPPLSHQGSDDGFYDRLFCSSSALTDPRMGCALWNTLFGDVGRNALSGGDVVKEGQE